MSIRWLAAVFLFSLGFGSAFLVRSQAAAVTPREGIIDGKLRYKDTGTDFQLSHPADDQTNYLIIVAEKGKDTVPRVAYPNGELTLRKAESQSVGIYQVIPLATVRFASPISNVLKCRPAYCPLPPDPGPPPGPINYSYQFLRSSSAVLKPVR